MFRSIVGGFGRGGRTRWRRIAGIAGSGAGPETVSGFAGVLASRGAPIRVGWCGRGGFVP